MEKKRSSTKRKIDLENQKTLISKDIDQVKEKFDYLKKVINIMESEFVECIKQAELESNMALVIKGSGLKRKSEESKQDIKVTSATKQ